MKKFLIPAAMLSLVFLSACVPKDRTKVEVNPYFGQTSNVNLEFAELYNDTVDAFGEIDENPYTYILDFDMNGSSESKTIDCIAYCMDDAAKEDAARFAAAVLRHCNDAAASQSNEFGISSRDSFGNLWDSYSLTFRIYPESAAETHDTLLLDLSVPAGSEIPLDPNIEKYEEEWENEKKAIEQNIIYDASGNIIFK